MCWRNRRIFRCFSVAALGARSITSAMLTRDERQRLVRSAFAGRAFPPVINYPEARQRAGISPFEGLFDRPVMIWVPECRSNAQKPRCVVPNCYCTPRIKEHKQRVVECVDAKVDLVYVKYQCTGTDARCFSTVSSAFLTTNTDATLFFSICAKQKDWVFKRTGGDNSRWCYVIQRVEPVNCKHTTPTPITVLSSFCHSFKSKS